MKLTIDFENRPLMPMVRPKQNTFLLKLLPTLPLISIVVICVGQYRENADNTVLALITILASTILWLVAYEYLFWNYNQLLRQEAATLIAYRYAVRCTLIDYLIKLPGITVIGLTTLYGTRLVATVVIANVDKSIDPYVSLAYTIENLPQKAREALLIDMHTEMRFSVETGAGLAIEEYMDTLTLDDLPTSISIDPRALIKHLLDRDLLVLTTKV